MSDDGVHWVKGYIVVWRDPLHSANDILVARAVAPNFPPASKGIIWASRFDTQWDRTSGSDIDGDSMAVLVFPQQSPESVMAGGARFTPFNLEAGGRAQDAIVSNDLFEFFVTPELERLNAEAAAAEPAWRKGSLPPPL